MSTHAEVQQQMQGRDQIPVRCPCGWDNDGRLTLVDRYASDYPPIPWCDIREIYRDDGFDPDDRVSECPACGEPLDPDVVVEQKAIA